MIFCVLLGICNKIGHEHSITVCLKAQNGEHLVPRSMYNLIYVPGTVQDLYFS